MKPIRNILLLGIIGMMVSCQFSEECNYTGRARLTMDWESLWGTIRKPPSLSVLFYRAGGLSAQRILLGDTIYENIPSGESEMLVLNQPPGVEYSGLNSIGNSEIHLPTFFEGNIRSVRECPMICAFNSHPVIPIEDIVEQTVTPLPIIKQLYFIVHVVKEGFTGTVSSCRASLSGIPTAYSLSRKEAIRSKATVFFSLEKNESEVDGDEYRHSFYVLGVNGKKEGEEDISKKLSVTVTLDNGEVKSDEIDITPELDDFSSNVFKCEVTVKINTLSTNVRIESWQQGTWDQIVIQ